MVALWHGECFCVFAVTELFNTVGPLQEALDYHLQRHNVLASNLAHVDTPGYRPRDVARIDADQFQQVLAVQMERTNPAHMVGGHGGAAIDQGRVFVDLTAGTGNDRNYVSLDREAAKLAANHLRYDVVSTMISAELRQLAYAVNDSKG